MGSVDPERFYVGFIGQSVVALSQVFVLSVPARLAAVWFGPDQVSSACSIGVFGNQVRAWELPYLRIEYIRKTTKLFSVALTSRAKEANDCHEAIKFAGDYCLTMLADSSNWVI